MNYIGSIVKILETPEQSLLRNNVIRTKVRAQLPQLRNTQIVKLTFWGNLAREINNYYKTNDYIIIEGYLSLKNETKVNLNFKVPKKIEITVSKFSPIPLNSEYLMSSRVN